VSAPRGGARTERIADELAAGLREPRVWAMAPEGPAGERALGARGGSSCITRGQKRIGQDRSLAERVATEMRAKLVLGQQGHTTRWPSHNAFQRLRSGVVEAAGSSSRSKVDYRATCPLGPPPSTAWRYRRGRDLGLLLPLHRQCPNRAQAFARTLPPKSVASSTVNTSFRAAAPPEFEPPLRGTRRPLGGLRPRLRQAAQAAASGARRGAQAPRTPAARRRGSYQAACGERVDHRSTAQGALEDRPAGGARARGRRR
jgi:hypothetical protein